MKTLLITIAMLLWCPSFTYANVAVLQDQFYALDGNKDKVLTEAEIQAQPDRIRFTDFYPQDSFLFADINQDGFISIDEFVEFEAEIPAE